MQATAEKSIIDETERERRREARERMKKAVKEASGYAATILCMMISHTRGKLHCTSYKKYHGGWRDYSAATKRVENMRKRGRLKMEDSDFQTYRERLGPGCERRWAEQLFAASIIESLDDQADFLRKFLAEEEKRQQAFKRVTTEGRRKPYSWETPVLDEELICARIVSHR